MQIRGGILTGLPRRTPITDNLFAWLAPWRESGTKGPVCPRRNGRDPRPDHERAHFIQAAEETLRRDLTQPQISLTYPHNGFRHSFGSYRMAIIKNEHQMACEVGNSVAMIKRNYNNPWPESEGQAWFEIFPPEGSGSEIQRSLLF